jgi:K+-transporting ATPase ATPase C chain
MYKIFSKSCLLLFIAVVITCVVYPLVLLAFGQVIFPFQSNGSVVNGSDGKPVGSLLIAQQFTKDEYFWPRPSAASYDGSASASAALAASNYALRNRVASMIGPIAKYAIGPKTGQLVAPDVEAWFRKDIYQGAPHIVGQWANNHNGLAATWVTSDSTHAAYVNNWAKSHAAVVAKFIKDNPAIAQPQAADLAVVFFQNFSEVNPGKFPSAVIDTDADKKTKTVIKPVDSGTDIQSIFFDMWRQEHPSVELQDLPGDMVTTSASGLDPHISLQNAEYQIERVVAKWAADLKRNPATIKNQVEEMIQNNTFAPMGGLFGEKMVNVLQLNIDLRNQFGSPQ